MHAKHVAFGTLFGFALARVGATDFDTISGMFHLSNLHLAGVMGVAIGLNALAFAAVRRWRGRTFRGEPIMLAPKPMTRGLVVGSLAFGAGWGLSGTCPGTAIAQIGEGRLAGLITFAGILLGAFLADRGGAEASPCGHIEPAVSDGVGTATSTAVTRRTSSAIPSSMDAERRRRAEEASVPNAGLTRRQL
jgi:uncharacterized protein